MAWKPTKSFFKFAALFALLSLGPASIYILYTRTGGPESQKERTFQRNLRYALMQDSATVDLVPLTSWGYETVCAIDSDVTEAEMTALIGFSYKDYDQLHWLRRTDHWTLLFIDSERETNWGMHRPVTPIRIPRDALTDLKLPAGAKGKCVAKTAAIPLTRHEAPVGVSPVTLNFSD